MDANELFKQYVYHSLLYYGMDTTEISDFQFDLLCRDLLKVFDQVTHPDKHLVTIADLEAGTGFQMFESWPEWALEQARKSGHEHWLLDQ